MGLFCVLLATLLNSCKGFCSKKVSSKLESLADNIDLSLLRSAICALMGLGFLFLGGITPALSSTGVAICIFAGAAISANYFVWVLSLKTDAYMFSSTANLSGFVVAVLGGVLFFGENLTFAKVLAIILIFVAMWFMVRYQIEFKGMPSGKDLLLLFSVFLTQGLFQLSQKLFTNTLPEISVHIYSFYSFVVSVVLLSLARAFIKHPSGKKAEAAKLKELLPFILIMGAALYGVTYFQALASSMMDAVVLYPLNNGLSLVAGSLMAWIAFKEKPTGNSIIGVSLVFVALILTRF